MGVHVRFLAVLCLLMFVCLIGFVVRSLFEVRSKPSTIEDTVEDNELAVVTTAAVADEDEDDVDADADAVCDIESGDAAVSHEDKSVDGLADKDREDREERTYAVRLATEEIDPSASEGVTKEGGILLISLDTGYGRQLSRSLNRQIIGASLEPIYLVVTLLAALRDTCPRKPFG